MPVSKCPSLTSILATRGVLLHVFAVCFAGWAASGALWLASGIYEPERLANPTWLAVYLVTRSLDRSLAAVVAATAFSHLRDRAV